MKSKRMAALLIACLMILPAASAKGEGYRLTPFDPLEGVGVITAESEMTPCTVTEEWIRAQGTEAEGAVDGETIGYAGNRIQQPMEAGMLSNFDLDWVGVLPDGETYLCVLDETFCAYRQGTLRVLTMDLTRSRPSQQMGFEPAIKMMMTGGPSRHGIGAQGIPVSPDGRFLLLNQASQVFRMMKSVYGLTLADLKTGQLFMAEPGGSLMSKGDDAVGVWSACFDMEGKLWYAATASRETALYRMDPQSGESEAVFRFSDAGLNTMFCEGMGTDANGRICFLGYAKESKAAVLCRCDPSTGFLVVDKLPVGLNKEYTPRMYTAAPGSEWIIAAKAPTQTEPSKDVYLCLRGDEVLQAAIEGGSLAFRPLSESPDGEPILQIAPTQDGSHVLVVTRDPGTGRYSGYYADMNTLETEPVDMEWLNETALNGNQVPVMTGGDPSIYKMGISFTGDPSLLIIPFMGSSTALVRLEKAD